MRTTKQKFFDFYSIVELYLRCGGFRDIGYPSYTVFVSHKIEERIRTTYAKIVSEFYIEIYNALVKSVKSELRHFPNECFDACYPELYVEAGLGKEKIRAVKKHPDVYPEAAKHIFMIANWKNSYGGKKWSNGAKLLIESKNVKTLQDKIYWIDRVLDLYHNSGHMINKTEFKCLSKCSIETKTKKGFTSFVKPLDFRAKAKSILDFIPFNSQMVRNLVIPRKNILTITA